MQLERPSERLFRSFQQSMLEWEGAHQDGAGIRDAALLATMPSCIAEGSAIGTRLPVEK